MTMVSHGSIVGALLEPSCPRNASRLQFLHEYCVFLLSFFLFFFARVGEPQRRPRIRAGPAPDAGFFTGFQENLISSRKTSPCLRVLSDTTVSLCHSGFISPQAVCSDNLRGPLHSSSDCARPKEQQQQKKKQNEQFIRGPPEKHGEILHNVQLSLSHWGTFY